MTRTRWAQDFAARHWGKILLVQTIVLVGLVLALLARTTGRRDAVAPAPIALSETDPQLAEGPTIWTCSMHPQIRQPSPGACPICGMDLIPVPKSAGGLRTLTITPEARALMRVETAPVERRYVTHAIRMVGRVDFDETRLRSITAWIPGRLDRLYVDYTGVAVEEGDHMVLLYSEELYSAQQEMIQAARIDRERGRAAASAGLDLLDATRERLRLLGLTEEQIREIEQQEKPAEHMTIYSPAGGVVIEKFKQEGERVERGDPIYTIADLSLLWVHLDVYESDLSWIRYGQDVTITTEAYPGDEFHGRIAFIQPVLDDRTRTVKARVNVPNEDGKLKPEMFVRATVRPQVAAGGRVMHPSLSGKWICPMHPEVVEDGAGRCDLCGMPLVQAESLGYVAADTDPERPPLVIPYAAVLPTGTRAIVYVELPTMHSAAEPAFQALSAAVQEGVLPNIREAFAVFGRMANRPYDQPGTEYARELWNAFADRLGQDASDGQRAETVAEAERLFGRIESVMIEVREMFAPEGQPTFEGREIVLGPRAGDHYLVRHGLEEGELVVRQGNFKIDSEVQIQARPSMMTPEGGGGGGHDHGDTAMESGPEEHAGHEAPLPADFQQSIRGLLDAYEKVAEAVGAEELRAAREAFSRFGEALAAVDGNQLTGHRRMVWKELAMLLGNDVVEGREAIRIEEAERALVLMRRHMQRLGEQLEVPRGDRQPEIEQVAVAAEFQTELARIWDGYIAMQEALAADEFQAARRVLDELESAVGTVDAQPPAEPAAQAAWEREHRNLQSLIEQLHRAGNIEAMREIFRPLSEQIGIVVRTFGLSEIRAVYELHCPMAFGGEGAIWYQADDDVRNPYYGAAMLRCADRVERLDDEEPPAALGGAADHSEH